MSNIATPTTPKNFASRLKDYIRKRRSCPVAQINPMNVDLSRELKRCQEREGKQMRRS